MTNQNNHKDDPSTRDTDKEVSKRIKEWWNEDTRKDEIYKKLKGRAIAGITIAAIPATALTMVVGYFGYLKPVARTAGQQTIKWLGWRGGL